jgi:glutaredoxin 3
MPADVLIYTTEYCPYCVRAKSLLRSKGVSFTEIDVSDRPDLREWLLSASKQRTVPQVFINGHSVGGFTDIAALDRKGALAPLLAAERKPEDPDVRR